jgi:hypothetical protein
MQVVVSLEKLVEEQEAKNIQEEGYRGNRFYAALQFAGDCIKENQEILHCDVPLYSHLKKGAEDCVGAIKVFYKKDIHHPKKVIGSVKRLFSRLASSTSTMAAETLKKPLSYTTAINSFSYAIFALNYSERDKQYFFTKKTNLSVFS